MIAVLRSTLFALIFWPGSLLFVLTAFSLGFSPRLVRWVADGWARFHGWCVRVLLGIRLVVHGTVPTGQVLIAAKHQSMFETIALLNIVDHPIIVLKAELARIPLWGWLARRYGMIPVDRSGSTRAMRIMLRRAQEARESGRTVVIFPEGTRVAVGDSPALRPGFAGLYKVLDLPTVPLTVDSGRLLPKHRFVRRSGVIHFRFGDPIPPGLPRKQAEAIVHAGINRDPTEPSPWGG